LNLNRDNPAEAKLLSLAMEAPLTDRTPYGWPSFPHLDQEPGEELSEYADRVEIAVEAYHAEVRRRFKDGLLRTPSGEVFHMYDPPDERPR